MNSGMTKKNAPAQQSNLMAPITRADDLFSPIELHCVLACRLQESSR
jgi:hypothetical protein